MFRAPCRRRYLSLCNLRRHLLARVELRHLHAPLILVVRERGGAPASTQVASVNPSVHGLSVIPVYGHAASGLRWYNPVEARRAIKFIGGDDSSAPNAGYRRES